MRVNLPKVQACEVGRPRYRVRNPIIEGKLYQYRQPLWDAYGAVVAVALAARILFQAPIAQAYTPIGGAAQVKSLYHTNMSQAGVLPSPEKFFAKAISLSVRSDIQAVADAVRFLYDTLLTFTIGGAGRAGGRPFLQAHAFKAPAAGGPFSASTAIVTNGMPICQPQFTFFGDLGEVVEQQQSFSVEVDPTQVVDASGALVMTTAAAAAGGTGINAHIYLDGVFSREVM